MLRELTPALRAYAARVETVLERVLPCPDEPPHGLHRAMRYAVLGGGKRIRPMLAYAACEAFGAAPERADACAAAVEIIHAYSLIHDDLPAMDDDDLRRGRPTCHVAFGEATAILAGDALQALSFEVIAADGALPGDAPLRVEMLRALASACGSHGMAGGQALDLDAVGARLAPAALERMHVLKTGALIRAAVRLGALASGASDERTLAALESYGHCVGLGFQIRDDILDIEGETAVTGKQQGADAARDKPTYPAILGLAESRRLAQVLRDEAIAALARASLQSKSLTDLAHYSVERDS
ncbi:MAG TPA: farnesyl diphosphate synthase [Candidatus Saccharimonadia bacterium]|nr:farnesyl diphosphate synthase [Candidatus Saccharimonadia bacterium]